MRRRPPPRAIVPAYPGLLLVSEKPPLPRMAAGTRRGQAARDTMQVPQQQSPDKLVMVHSPNLSLAALDAEG